MLRHSTLNPPILGNFLFIMLNQTLGLNEEKSEISDYTRVAWCLSTTFLPVCVCVCEGVRCTSTRRRWLDNKPFHCILTRFPRVKLSKILTLIFVVTFFIWLNSFNLHCVRVTGRSHGSRSTLSFCQRTTPNPVHRFNSWEGCVAPRRTYKNTFLIHVLTHS